jgi:hypothetical protein
MYSRTRWKLSLAVKQGQYDRMCPRSPFYSTKFDVAVCPFIASVENILSCVYVHCITLCSCVLNVERLPMVVSWAGALWVNPRVGIAMAESRDITPASE